MTRDITDVEWDRYLKGRCPRCLGDPEAPDHPCHCGLMGDDYMCINGIVYGPCGDEHCGGVCVIDGDCDCDCHKQETP